MILVDGKSASSLPSTITNSLKAKGVNTILITGGDGAVNTRIETSLKKTFTTVTRLSGLDRYATNTAVNDYLTRMTSTPVTNMWIATGKNFPDALSAGAPSATLNQRLVLSNGKCIAKNIVNNQITNTNSAIGTVYLVGGTGVLNNDVAKLKACP